MEEQEKTQEPTADTLVWFGGSVKALGDGKVGGYLVRFSGPSDPDLEGDYFDAATDFGEVKSSPVYYQHGMDPAIKMRKLGVGDLVGDEVGIWIAAQLNLRDEYEKAIYEMAEAGKLGWSSGTASHLVEVEQVGKAFHIKHWPLGLDASLTPTPAEPRNSAVPLKSLIDQPEQDAAQNAASVEPAIEDGGDITPEPAAEPVIEFVKTSEDNIMSEEVKDTEGRNEGAEMAAMKSQMDALTEKLNAVLGAVEASPKLERGGYHTNYGGKADPGHKSFGDWLLAVKRRDYKRLNEVYAQKDLGGDVGVDGGFLVPEDYRNQLLQIAQQASPVVNRVNQVPVEVGSGYYPALDYSVSPTAGSGQTAYAAGLSAATTEENAALTEDQPLFKQIQWNLNKVGGFTEVSNELIADSPQSIEVLLTQLFGVTIGNVNERNILRGSGAGQPLGMLNADCAVAVAPAANNTFGEADALTMLSRFKKVSASAPVWIMHPGVIPDLNGFTSTSSVDMVVFGDGGGGVSGRLLGYEIIYSEHLPQDDNAGNVMLVDPGSYLFFRKGGLRIDFSEHASFTSDRGVWRFTERNDGQPWLLSAITLADPQGSYTVSPIVYHND